MPYTTSPYPEDYSTRAVYKGINIYNKIPNRYPYMYDIQPLHSLYAGVARRTPKPFPYTNRPWTESTVYASPQYYESLLDAQNLRPAYTFYGTDKFML